jgi:hypothetical protein
MFARSLKCLTKGPTGEQLRCRHAIDVCGYLILFMSTLPVLGLGPCGPAFAQIETARRVGAVAALTDKDAIVVDESSVASDDSDDDIVRSNIDFINELRGQHIRFDEVSQDALRSYQVDYYLAQMLNGGFAQFVMNSGWGAGTVSLVREGLAAMGATEHLELFEVGTGLVQSLGDAGLKRFFATSIQDYAKSPELAVLKAVDDRFFALDKRHSLSSLNRAWLRSHPNLVRASAEQIKAEILRRAGLVPDRAERIAAAEANAPRYLKLIRALVAKSGQQLLLVTAGDPNRMFEGAPTTAWYFRTDQGLFHMVDAGGKAIMFRGRSTTDRVCEIDAP